MALGWRARAGAGQQGIIVLGPQSGTLTCPQPQATVWLCPPNRAAVSPCLVVLVICCCNPDTYLAVHAAEAAGADDNHSQVGGGACQLLLLPLHHITTSDPLPGCGARRAGAAASRGRPATAGRGRAGGVRMGCEERRNSSDCGKERAGDVRRGRERNQYRRLEAPEADKAEQGRQREAWRRMRM